jgi:hypothetical protein
MISPAGKDPIDQWIIDRVAGQSFVDIGGIGVDSINERITIAVAAGASSYTMADIRPRDHREWEVFHGICRDRAVAGVVKLDGVDVRDRINLQKRVGVTDIVHCTGINYHLPSPADALWNLRSITNRFLITNTVTFPGRIENEYGSVLLPDCAILFGAALTDTDRRVLNKYYKDKFGWDMDYASPPPGTKSEHGMDWVQGEELCCWPYWYLYTDHAFRSLLAVCKLRILDEWKWCDHALAVLCEPIQ